MEKPKVLILGGCGFLGRNLTAYLVANDLVSHVRIVDKMPPQVAWLNDEHKRHFDNPIVEFRSANLINPESCANAFANEGSTWDFVINCAGETKLGQSDPVYQEGILNLSLNCANNSAKLNVRRYIEISAGQIYSNDKTPHKEDGPVDSWTFVSKWKSQVEKELPNIPNLRYTILRPALIYGYGDKTGMTTRLIAAAIYKTLGETMRLLWNSNILLNTVWVQDVCRAIWFVCQREDTIGEIYNVVDDACSTQGSLADILSELFNLKVDYYGTLVSTVVDLTTAADEANDKHLGPWAEACRKDGIQNTPLSPHMHSELLLKKHLNLDGTKLKNLGFQYDVPKPTLDKFKAIIDDFIAMKIFPQCLME